MSITPSSTSPSDSYSILNQYPAEIKFPEIETSKANLDEKVKLQRKTLKEFCKQMDPNTPNGLTLKTYFEKFCSLLDITSDSTEHPFVQAVRENKEKIITIFLSFREKGFDVNCSGKDGKTAAHAAAMSGNVHLFDTIEDLDLEAQDVFENRPIHCAVMGKKENSVEWLAKKKVNLNRANRGSYTPLKLATMERFDRIVEILEENNAR